MTSDDLIEAVKRKISFPISQVTFDEDDILAFANEEMAISQVPSILQYHEEYLVATEDFPLESNRSTYPIPSRAIGMKLRDLFWRDNAVPVGNLYEMTRVNSDDRATWQGTVSFNNGLSKFYVQGNDVVLVPGVGESPTGTLVFVFFLRPNQLVENDQAAIVSSFTRTITVDFSVMAANDTLTIGSEVFTAKASGAGANEFNIGVSSIATATNLVSSINTNGIGAASNVSGTSAVVTFVYSTTDYDITASNIPAFAIQSTILITTVDNIPSNITVGSEVDFLQTKAGHKTLAYDIVVPTGAIATNTITFSASVVPEGMVLGDYICSANECIIPQIPTDLHTSLSERTCSRILAAMGDLEALQASSSKVKEIDQAQGSLLDNRVEGAPQKITGRHSALRYGKMRTRRFW